MQTFWSRGGIPTRTAAVALGAALVAWPAYPVAPASEVRVTEVFAEIAVPPDDGADLQASQLVAEVVIPSPPATIYVSQALIEIVMLDVELVSEHDDDDRGVIGPIVWVEWPVPDPPT